MHMMISSYSVDDECNTMLIQLCNIDSHLYGGPSYSPPWYPPVTPCMQLLDLDGTDLASFVFYFQVLTLLILMQPLIKRFVLVLHWGGELVLRRVRGGWGKPQSGRVDYNLCPTTR